MVLNFNAFAEFEAASGRNAFDLIDEVAKGTARVTDLRNCMWAALRQRHPDMTLVLAGEIMSAYPDAVNLAIGAAIAPKGDVVPGK